MSAAEFLAETEIEGRDFRDLALQEASLAGRLYEGCTFTGCDFQRADLAGARFVDCEFRRCDLSNAKADRASFRAPKFEECKLLGFAWSALGELFAPDFLGCEMRYGHFAELKLKRARFERCGLRECDFTGADLAESSFRDSDLAGAAFARTSLLKCDFRGATGYAIDPSINPVRGARFAMPEAQGLLAGLGIRLD